MQKCALVFLMAFLAVMASCSATQKISVKQSQGEQSQDVQIETTSKVDNLALIFNYPNYGTNN